MNNAIDERNLIRDALSYHQNPSGKICINLSKKPNLRLGYTPGVAHACLEIYKNPSSLYNLTYLNNSVGIISNGTAILGLGNLGAAPAMPVMEGKCMIFKYYAGIDAIPIVIDEQDPIKLTEIIKKCQYSFGGINLEDIKAPDCFFVEEELKKALAIPVFHDDQHGTAIVVCAGLFNALKVVKKDLESAKIVINGSGSAGIATADLLKSFGAKNVIMCDTKGVIFEGRLNGMNEFKQRHAVPINSLPHNSASTWSLEDVITDADVFIGVSSKGALSQQMLVKMAPNPIIFALANPDPEILPNEALEARPDAIVATGRSDFPNQINNMLCFPYMFRASLDTKSKLITLNMKQAAALALSSCVSNPDRNNIIPQIFQPFNHNYECENPILEKMTIDVIKAAIKDEVAQNLFDLDKYKTHLFNTQTQLYKQMNALKLI